MKNGTNKRIRVYLKSLGNGISCERLFRALSLILSEEDLRRYLTANRDMECRSDFDECREKSKALAGSLANS
jgi:hypothetical protein